jgi:hypothetical protein
MAVETFGGHLVENAIKPPAKQEPLMKALPRPVALSQMPPLRWGEIEAADKPEALQHLWMPSTCKYLLDIFEFNCRYIRLH